MDLNFIFNQQILPYVWRVIGAIAIWIVGGQLIKLSNGLLNRALQTRQVDATVIKYSLNGAAFLMRLLLIIAIFGVLGIETTSFAALLAGVGLAIGAAWGGLLTHFAAGIFLLFLRPFKVGDTISAGGVNGEVRELGLLATTIDTGDNLRIFVGNNKIFSDNIINYSANPYRRVDLAAQLAHSVDPNDAIRRLKTRLAQIPNVLKTPEPSVEILTFNERGPVLAVRPFCHNDHYWQVYFDANKVIAAVSAEAGYAIPEDRLAVRKVKSK